MFRIALAALAVALLAGQALAAEWKRLVEPAELAALVGTGITVIDIRPPSQFALGRVPGALNAPYGSWRGPKTNPGQALDDAGLTERLQSLGITRDDRVVVTYHGKDDTDFGAAARVYWTLKSAGLTEIAILNGGLVAWVRAGNALSTEPATVERSSETFALSDEWMITRDGVRDAVDGRADVQLVDARPLDFLRGKKKHPAASAPGTLAGTAHVVHSTWFRKDNDRVVGPVEDVIRLAREAGIASDGSRPVASFCNTGHWAATNWFALSEIAGVKNVKLYPESMVGWTNADQPVVRQP